MNALPLFDSRLTDADARVLGVIQAHRRARPVALSIICVRTGLRRRAVLDSINRLILVHRNPIGSSRGKNAGFWLAESVEDRVAAARPFRRQAVNELVRISVLLNRHDLAEIAGQLRISEGDTNA